jgi:hypothetical protein
VSFEDCEALMWSFGQNLVDVHVRGRPGPGLEDVHREVLVELTGLDALCRIGDRRGQLLVDATHPERGVDGRGVTLDGGQ